MEKTEFENKTDFIGPYNYNKCFGCNKNRSEQQLLKWLGCVRAHVRVCVCVRVRVCVLVHACACACVSVCAYMCVHVQ